MNHRRTAFVLMAIVIFAGSLQAAIPAAERQALIALYEATGGDSWTNNTGWKNPPLDTDGFAMPGTENGWFGVTVSAERVTAINQAVNNLIGSLPAAVGDLTALTGLNLRSNQLSGSVPSSIGNLTSLTVLHLDGNLFTGSVPTEIGALVNLVQLTLNTNSFTGQIPASFGNLTALQQLYLNDNEFSGSIPTELGSLTNLEYFNCHLNQLNGSLPASLGSLSSMRTLLLHNNLFNGSIPTELGNLSDLEILYISNNELTGSIPASFGALDNLIDLDLSNNLLSGSIPAELGDMASLQFLRLQFNDLSGSIPSELGGLSNLIELTIQFNDLTGSLPAELGDLAALEVIYLQSNLLTGAIPSQLSALSNLEILYLQNNQLTGAIPAQLSALTSLRFLRLDSNLLTGTIPPEFGSMPALVDLFLGDNQLEGTIPTELGNLTGLEALFLKSNKLQGPIPSSLTNLTLLDPEPYTDFGYNALYTSDPAVAAFIATKDPDWASTQTVAPSDVTATPVDGAGIVVSWVPIDYTEDGGYYTVFSSETSGGPYTSAGQTANKSASSLQVNGLVPGRTYYFVVQTHTNAHSGNQNSVDSGYSEEAFATAWTQVSVSVSGTVTVGGSPLAGVEMSGLPTNPLTNSSGVYNVSVDAGWSGTVTPTLSGYTFTPSFRTYTEITENQLNQDYAATLIPATITVTSPNGGESWIAGSTHDVTWTASGLTGDVTIDLYKSAVYQKTLGTADVSAGTFSWAIAAGETAGTDYRILVWQGGTSDESDGDFAILSKIRVDFNLDGQEDILWRYQGTGANQGLVLAWLMNQTEPISSTTLLEAQVEEAQRSILTEPFSDATLLPPLESKITKTSAARNELKTITRREGLLTTEPKLSVRDAIDGGHIRAASARERIEKVDLLGIPTMTDAADITKASGGTTDIAAISRSNEVIIARVSDTAWEIAGTGDFNSDGKVDILWRYYGPGTYQGLNVIWHMDGTTRLNEVIFSRVSDTNWRIVGTGDFNFDGKTDVLWRYHGPGTYEGLNIVWYMDGTTRLNEVIFSRVSDTNWRIGGTGDFNSDGRVDILWRYHGTGTYEGLNVVWHMDGITRLNEVIFSRVTDTAWEIGGTGDFDADGKVDILWRYYGPGTYQGLNVMWYMDGVTRLSEEIFNRVSDTNWRIVNR